MNIKYIIACMGPNIQNICKNNLHVVCILFTIVYFREISVNIIQKRYER